MEKNKIETINYIRETLIYKLITEKPELMENPEFREMEELLFQLECGE